VSSERAARTGPAGIVDDISPKPVSITPTAAGRTHDAAIKYRRALEGPIVTATLRLAAPPIIASLAQMLIPLTQAYFISKLGTDALAGLSLVFPCLLLMSMASLGVAGGVGSVVARNLGAGRTAEAEALIVNAIALAMLFGAAFSAIEALFGPTLLQFLGGSGRSLAAGLAYADIIFGASVLIWLGTLLGSALVGAGNTMVPSLLIMLGVIIVVPLSPILMFGWGPAPRLGIAGAGWAVAVSSIVSLAVLMLYFHSKRSPLRLSLDVRLVERRFLSEILRLGGVSAIAAIIPSLTLALVTAAVGRFGSDAIAGYGAASRVDFVLLPLYNGIGTGVLTMVGTNVGAKLFVRARQAAWLGALVAAGVGCATGLVFASAPLIWLGCFTEDPTAIAVGSLYLHTVGLQYAFVGLGVVLTAASIGAGRAFLPLLANIIRMSIAAGCGWIVMVGFGAGVEAVFVAVALSGVAFCGTFVTAEMLGHLIPRREPPTPRF
jgi:putative MATE family efflux protein